MMLVTIDGVTYLANKGTKRYEELQRVIMARRLGFDHPKVTDPGPGPTTDNRENRKD